MLRYLTAGESHGLGLMAILDGMPAGVKVDIKFINAELKRRQMGLGRGRRMEIETDKAKIISGLKKDITLGSPIALLVENKDVKPLEKLAKVVCPRPGHADLAGVLKYGFNDIRDVWERASARGTAVMVGIGAICKIFLKQFKVEIDSKVVCIGGEISEQAKKEKIELATNKKDTLGGIFEINVKGLPVGLGSYAQFERRLDARFAQAIMAIPGVKGMEVGLGFAYADKFGSLVHDAIYYSGNKGYYRKTNNAGGIEGGVSNGEEIILRACMKPISTLMRPLDSVNIITKKPSKAVVLRSDICAVEPAGIVAESAVAYVLADAFLEKFGGDDLVDIKLAYKNYLKRILC